MSKTPGRITKEDEKLVSSLNYEGIEVSIMKELNFLFQKKITVKLKNKTIFVLMCFVMKMD